MPHLPQAPNPEIVAGFDLMISAVPGVVRKGATMPYVSVNGNVYAMISKADVLGLRLDRDDLASIEAVLRDSAEGLEIETDGFQFDSLEELTTKFHDRTLRGVDIRTRRPYVSIELTRMWAKLYLGSSINASAGLFYRLDRILSRARRPLWPLYSYYFIWVLNGVFLLSTPLHRYIGASAATPLVAGSLAWVIWANCVRFRRHSLITLAARGSSSFWARKKDDLLLALVSALLGAILGVAGTLLAPYVHK